MNPMNNSYSVENVVSNHYVWSSSIQNLSTLSCVRTKSARLFLLTVRIWRSCLGWCLFSLLFMKYLRGEPTTFFCLIFWSAVMQGPPWWCKGHPSQYVTSHFVMFTRRYSRNFLAINNFFVKLEIAFQEEAGLVLVAKHIIIFLKIVIMKQPSSFFN